MKMRIWLIGLIIVTSLSPSFAQRWQFCLLISPQSYQLRWGEVEPPDADMVEMPPGLDTKRARPTSPGCYKVGMGGFWLAYSVEDFTEFGELFVVVWDAITGETIWQMDYSPVPKEGWVSLEGFVLPSYITVVGFQVVWLGSATMFTRFNVFVVLDEPKAPMNPAWVSVLRISCQWARGENTPDGAARRLTLALHQNGTYNGGLQAYTRYPPDPDTGEDFYLRAYLDADLSYGEYWGQCNDFADFLVCLMTSVGIQRVAQRTHSLVSSRRVTTLPSGELGVLLGFETHPLDAAPTGASDWDGRAEWFYHQFCLDQGASQVWDGSIAFLSQNWQPGDPVANQIFVLGMAREPDYRNRLVVRYRFLTLTSEVVVEDPAFFWQPTPTSGFIPNVNAGPLPP